MIKRPRRRPLSICSILSVISFLLWSAVLPVFAQPAGLPAYIGHVNDFANLIDSQTRTQLEGMLSNFEKASGIQIAVVTIQSLEGRPLEEYATALYRAWGIGAREGPNKDRGALLLVALQDRKTRLEVGYGLEGDLPDGLAGELIRRMRPYLQQQDYSQGMAVGTRTLVDTLAEKLNISIEGLEDRRFAYQPEKAERRGSRSSGGPLIFVIIFVIIVLIGIFKGRGGRRGGPGRGSGQNLWWLAPIIFNRSGGSFGGGSWGNSGGWGGSGGGGSWGGFGGGSSGGGGASDSW